MGLETFTGKVSDLVITNPPGTDPKSQGDDHICGVKKTIVGQSVNMQIGQSSTATQNFTFVSATDGTVKLARGNSGATTQDVMTVDSLGKVAFPQSVRAILSKSITIGTVYTNNTGLEIAFNAVVNSPSGVRVVTLVINGLVVASARAEFNVSDSFISGTVPIGGTFLVALVTGTGGVLTGNLLMNGPAGGVTP